MTVIAAYKDNKYVWIGSDSMGSTASGFKVEYGPKLISKQNYIIGFCDSYRVADIIRETSALPAEINTIRSLSRFRDIIKALMIEDGAAASADIDDTIIHPIGVLIAAPRGIYTMGPDYQIHAIKEEFRAIGSGCEIATGSLEAAKAFKIKDGKKVIKVAIKSAIKHIGSCGGKYHIKSVKLLKG